MKELKSILKKFPSRFIKKFKKQDIVCLRLPISTYNALNESDICTIGKLIENTEVIHYCNGIGDKSLEYIKHNLKELLQYFLEKEYVVNTKETFDDSLNAILERLTEMQREVIKLRYGYPKGTLLTYTRIARKLSVSDSRVRQLEIEALERVDKEIQAHKIIRSLERILKNRQFTK